MAKVLKIEFGADTDSDQVDEIHLTALSIPLNDDNVAQAAEMVVQLADSLDKSPGDEVADISTKIKVPVLKILGRQINVSVPITVSMKIEDVE